MKKNKKKNRRERGKWKELLPIVITTCIAGIIIEIVKLIFGSMPALCNGIICEVRDYIYRSATQAIDYYFEQFLVFTTVITVGSTMVLYIYRLIKRYPYNGKKRRLKEHGIKKILSKYSGLKSNLRKSDAQQTISITNNQRIRKRILFIIYGITFVLFAYIAIIRPIQLKIKFGRDIDLIVPYTSIHQVDILKSKWSQMKNQYDYTEIYSVIDKIVDERSLDKRIIVVEDTNKKDLKKRVK